MTTFAARAQVIDGQDFSLVWRLLSDDGALILVADALSYEVSVYDMDSVSPETPIWTSGVITKTGSPLNFSPVVLYDALQVDGFAFDPIGYNFRYRMLRSHLDKVGGHRLRIEIEVKPDGSNGYGTRKMAWDIDVIPMMSTTT